MIPTQPGFYWARYKDDDEWFIVHVKPNYDNTALVAWFAGCEEEEKDLETDFVWFPEPIRQPS